MVSVNLLMLVIFVLATISILYKLYSSLYVEEQFEQSSNEIIGKNLDTMENIVDNLSIFNNSFNICHEGNCTELRYSDGKIIISSDGEELAQVSKKSFVPLEINVDKGNVDITTTDTRTGNRITKTIESDTFIINSDVVKDTKLFFDNLSEYINVDSSGNMIISKKYPVKHSDFFVEDNILKVRQGGKVTSLKNLMSFKGEQGKQGKQGVSGDIGAPGLNGVDGIDGDKGLLGDIGLTGDIGQIGNQINGDKGLTGSKGLTGVTGLTGNKGPVGDKGPVGEAGETCRVSEWGPWSSCSKTCGGGTKKRYRTVLSGHSCPSLSEKASCNTRPCPVDCVLGKWSSWSPCTKACGGGTQFRTRKVIRDWDHNGKRCGSMRETRSCNTKSCAVDCVVGNWGPWSMCSKLCGGGKRYRVRPILRSPAHGGKSCPTTREEVSCNTHGCPVDCVVSNWGGWSGCSKPCGGGTKCRTRHVIRAPSNGGRGCPSTRECTRCNTHGCPRPKRRGRW